MKTVITIAVAVLLILTLPVRAADDSRTPELVCGENFISFTSKTIGEGRRLITIRNGYIYMITETGEGENFIVYTRADMGTYTIDGSIFQDMMDCLNE